MRVSGRVAAGLVVGFGWGSSSCAPSGFADPALLTSVRILASSANEPYAKPGDPVRVRVLAYDGRPAAQRTAPMNVVWLPFVCENPAQDAYYECFRQLLAELGGGAGPGASPCPPGSGIVNEAGAPDGDDAASEADDDAAAGSDASSDAESAPVPDASVDTGTAPTGDSGSDAGMESAAPPPGDAGAVADVVPDGAAGADASAGTEPDACSDDADCAIASPDATIPVPVESSFEFTMPCNVVTSHPPVAGSGPYGLVILFNMACAGHLAPLPLGSSDNPQQLPVGCFDDAGTQLGANDYVFGYTRVYSYLGSDGGYDINQNPVVASFDLGSRDGGTAQATIQGSSPSFAVSAPFAAVCTPASCPQVPIGPTLTPDSWEVNPLDVGPNGVARHEEIWADYYSTFGGFKSDTRLLYDPTTGAVSNPDTDFNPPSLAPTDPHDGVIFVVVHDDRGGASWVTIPMHVCSDSCDPACLSPCPDGGCSPPPVCSDGGPSAVP
ncbi:MAG: hypothetical protein ABSF69_06095 [Polyangiaceae bacterium]|jgi:hypothetical protein